MTQARVIKVPALEMKASERQKRWSQILMFTGVASILFGIGSCTVGNWMERAKAPSGDAVQLVASSEAHRVEDKIATDAVAVMTPAEYHETYAKLGKAAFDKANELAPWAARAAAQDASCERVELVGISSSATRSNLKWFVNCAGGVRLNIDQSRAEEEKTRQDQAKGEK